MWEKDKQILNAFKECYANLIQSLNNGEDVDFKSTCVEETEALTSYTITQIGLYKDKHPSELSERKQKAFNPMQPYFQDL